MIELMENIAIGTDIENISRFKDKTVEKDKAFFDKIFTKNELEYSFSKSNPAQHLAARYCAKEAVIKALSTLNITKPLYNEIEILNNPDGAPYVNLINDKNIFSIKISLSHCKETAIAFVIVGYVRK